MTEGLEEASEEEWWGEQQKEKRSKVMEAPSWEHDKLYDET